MSDEQGTKWEYQEMPAVRVSRWIRRGDWLIVGSMLMVLLVVISSLVISHFVDIHVPEAVPAVIGISVLLAVVLACLFYFSALHEVERSGGLIKGEGGAWVRLFFFGFIFYAGFVMPAMSGTLHLARRLVCGVNMKGLGCAMTVYANDYYDMAPGEAWCDLLIEKTDVASKSLICPSSKDKVGECSYALNKYVIGKPLTELPAGTVLLFETTLGSGGETGQAQDREGYKKYTLVQEALDADQKVRLGRWNQVGGPEDLSVGNHEGQGAFFVFTDGHGSFEKIDGIKQLRWDPEDESVRWDESMIKGSDRPGERVPVEVRRRHVRNLLAGAGGLAAVGFVFVRSSRMKVYTLVIAAAAAVMGAFWGAISEGYYEMYDSSLTRIGWLVGLVFGMLAAVGYCLVMTRNLRRGRVVSLEAGRFRIQFDVLTGMWTGLLCSLAVHGTLWMYHSDTRGGGIIHGIYWGLLVGVITGAIARWIFVGKFSEKMQAAHDAATMVQPID